MAMASKNKSNDQLTWRKALKKESWFHGDISCDEAEARLSVAGTTVMHRGLKCKFQVD